MCKLQICWNVHIQNKSFKCLKGERKFKKGKKEVVHMFMTVNDDCMVSLN